MGKCKLLQGGGVAISNATKRKGVLALSEIPSNSFCKLVKDNVVWEKKQINITLYPSYNEYYGLSIDSYSQWIENIFYDISVDKYGEITVIRVTADNVGNLVGEEFKGKPPTHPYLEPSQGFSYNLLSKDKLIAAYYALEGYNTDEAVFRIVALNIVDGVLRISELYKSNKGSVSYSGSGTKILAYDKEKDTVYVLLNREGYLYMIKISNATTKPYAEELGTVGYDRTVADQIHTVGTLSNGIAIVVTGKDMRTVNLRSLTSTNAFEWLINPSQTIAITNRPTNVVIELDNNLCVVVYDRYVWLLEVTSQGLKLLQNITTEATGSFYKESVIKISDTEYCLVSNSFYFEKITVDIANKKITVESNSHNWDLTQTPNGWLFIDKVPFSNNTTALRFTAFTKKSPNQLTTILEDTVASYTHQFIQEPTNINTACINLKKVAPLERTNIEYADNNK